MLMLLDLSRLQCVCFLVIFQRYAFDTYLGDDLEAGIGSPPGTLEEQVRSIPVVFAVSRPNQNSRTALEDCCSWLCRRTNRHRSTSFFSRFQGLPSYHRAISE